MLPGTFVGYVLHAEGGLGAVEVITTSAVSCFLCGGGTFSDFALFGPAAFVDPQGKKPLG